MITAANYVLKATVNGTTYSFEYGTQDVLSTLCEFWHEDYPEMFLDVKGGEMFPIDVLAMDNGKEIHIHSLVFNAAVFHAFYDHGHNAAGVYTFSDFLENVKRKDGDAIGMVKKVKKVSNDITSFFYYMWNKWSEEECKTAFKDGDYNHFWNKWCEAYDTMHGPRGAAEYFYMMLSDSNRDKLVKRALECYNGMTEKY